MLSGSSTSRVKGVGWSGGTGSDAACRRECFEGEECRKNTASFSYDWKRPVREKPCDWMTYVSLLSVFVSRVGRASLSDLAWLSNLWVCFNASTYVRMCVCVCMHVLYTYACMYLCMLLGMHCANNMHACMYVRRII